jgi:hypothetical protein
LLPGKKGEGPHNSLSIATAAGSCSKSDYLLRNQCTAEEVSSRIKMKKDYEEN